MRRSDHRPKIGGAEAFLTRLSDMSFEPARGSPPPETAEAFMSRLGFHASKLGIDTGASGIVERGYPERGGDSLLSKRKDLELLQSYLTQAELLAQRVKPEIVSGLKGMQQAAASPSRLPAGLQPHAQPPRATVEELPTWARPVANLTDTELVQRRLEQRLRKRKSRALQKEI